MKSNCNNPAVSSKPKWCDEKDCRYWLPWYCQDACTDCRIAPKCKKFDRVDDSAQTTIDFGDEE